MRSVNSVLTLMARVRRVRLDTAKKREILKATTESIFRSINPSPPVPVARCPQQSLVTFSKWNKVRRELASTSRDLFVEGLLKQGKIKISERLGELGMIDRLQDELEKAGQTYDEKCLHIFSGKDTFNGVYVWPSLDTPELVVVLEGKGGTSQCGTRTVETDMGPKKLKQGTIEYLEEEVEVMKSRGGDKEKVATAISQAMEQNPSNVIYMGVRTAYDSQAKEVFQTEVIFVQRL